MMVWERCQPPVRKKNCEDCNLQKRSDAQSRLMSLPVHELNDLAAHE
jgi:hypothetical protein